MSSHVRGGNLHYVDGRGCQYKPQASTTEEPADKDDSTGVCEENGEEGEEVERAGDDHQSGSPAEPLNADPGHQTPTETSYRQQTGWNKIYFKS